MMKIPFEDERTYRINELVLETIYHAAMEASVEISQIYGPYETFKGSPLSEGKF
jgi:ribonucleoside-diphosphate reductase alpha chain